MKKLKTNKISVPNLGVKADVVVKDPNKEYEDEGFEYQKALACVMKLMKTIVFLLYRI